MLALILGAVAISGLADRPSALVGPAGQAAYEGRLNDYLNLDGITVRRKLVFGDCATVIYKSAGFDLLGSMDYRFPIDWFSHEKPSSDPKEVDAAAIEHVDVKGCGITYRHNFIAWHDRANRGASMYFYTDGTSIASRPAQNKAEMIAVNMIQDGRRHAAAPDNCRQVPIVYNTRVDSPPDAAGTWIENWSIAVCDVKHDARITFSPSPTGAQVAVSIIN